MKVRPIYNSIVLTKVSVDDLTDSSIIIPSDKATVSCGKIVEVGPDVDNFRKDEIVIYDKYATSVDINNVSYLVISSSDVIAIIE